MSASVSGRSSQFVDNVSDRLNPILVKETRQALKSRQFVATFFLVLVASWLISVLGFVLGGPGLEYREVGQRFFSAYYVVLAIASFIVVPFGAFRSMLGERDLHTWEVLSITTLRPRQIVWGKLTSAVVQLFIYYSAITPFIAFANLLKGIDVPTIAFILVVSMFWSLALSMAALSISTFGNQKYWQVFQTLGVLWGLVSATGAAFSITFAGLEEGFPFDIPAFWWGIGLVASFVAAYSFLSLQIAVAQLTFDADNRSTGIRLAAAGISWLALAWFGGALFLQGRWGIPTFPITGLDEVIITFATLAGMHWFAVGLFAATETDTLSRRVRRDISRWGAFRVIASPLIPGGNRGMVYFLIHISLLFAVVSAISGFLGSLGSHVMLYCAGLWCYLVIYVGLGAAFGRAARAVSREFRPAHARVLTVLLVAFASMLPLILYAFESIRMAADPNPLFFVTDPFSTLYRLAERNPWSNQILVVIGIGAFVSLLLNLRAMLAGITDVAREYVPPTPAVPSEIPAVSH